MTLRRFRDLLNGLPTEGTALRRKVLASAPTGGLRVAEPPADLWTLDRHLLASAVDALNMLMWAKTKDATTGSNRPRPIPRPGVSDGARMGTPMPAAALLAILRPDDNREAA